MLTKKEVDVDKLITNKIDLNPKKYILLEEDHVIIIKVSIHQDLQILDLCIYNTWYENNYSKNLQT